MVRAFRPLFLASLLTFASDLRLGASLAKSNPNLARASLYRRRVVRLSMPTPCTPAAAPNHDVFLAFIFASRRIRYSLRLQSTRDPYFAVVLFYKTNVSPTISSLIVQSFSAFACRTFRQQKLA